ncbi:MAG: amidohydrolase family protein, partial [candidate division WOR-3 bacterium]
MADLLLKNSSQLLTMTGAGLGIVENGSVWVEGGRIVEVRGGSKAGRVIDCRGCVVLPGFVDPHTHLVFGGWRAEEFEERLAGKSYQEIAEAGGGILSTVRATRQASEEELYRLARERLKEMVSWGTTTVEVKSGYGLDTENELKMLRVAGRLGESGLATVVPTFLGAHAVPKGMKREAFVREVIDEMLPAVARQGIARFCDVFCENIAFTPEDSVQILEAGKGHGLLPTVHADELGSSAGAEVAARVGALSASHLLQPSDSGL